MTGFGGLFASEVRRFFSRRFFKGLGLAMVAMLLLQLGVAFFLSSNDPDSGLAEARRDIAACERAERSAVAPDGQPVDFGCGTVEDLRGAYDKRFYYARSMEEVFRGLGVIALILGLVAGASFVGAEWGTGSMATLLTWEPRRGRVLLAKVLACLAIVAATVSVALVLIALLFFPVGVLRGTTDGATRSFWWTQAGIGVRDMGLSMFGAAFGIGLATFIRNTAGAIGVGFFYGSVVDSLLSFWQDGLIREWLLQYNIARLLGEAVESRGEEFVAPGEAFTQVTLSATRPTILLASYGVALLLLAWAVFRSRDVA